MGGERFDQGSPECYLFGDNLDLNWLGTKPIAVSKKKIYLFSSIWNWFLLHFHSQFPYLPPKNTEPTKTLKSLVNVRKESVKFVKADGEGKGYNIEVRKAKIEFWCELLLFINIPFAVCIRCWYEMCNKNLLFLHRRDYDKQHSLHTAWHSNDLGNILLSKRTESSLQSTDAHFPAEQIFRRWPTV